MRRNVEKLTKRDWYARGGFANPRLFRKANAHGVWAYFIRHD